MCPRRMLSKMADVDRTERNEMSIIVNDASLLKQLTGVSVTIEIRDADGNFLGTFAPPRAKLPPGIKSPHTDEEIEQFRKQPGGRPLAEILRDLEKQA
jgi:hypothetical protein